MTDAEIKLWNKIRRRQILGVQFYRQRPVGPYIVDFLARVPKIAIELDGGQHCEPEHKNSDRVRNLYLESLDIRVLRFNNLNVMSNCDRVLQVIYDAIIGGG